MMPKMTLAELFSERKDALKLDWAAGEAGAQRQITGEMLADHTKGSVGHLNLIRSLLVQVVGRVEHHYFMKDGLPKQNDRANRLFAIEPCAIIQTDGLPLIPALVERANAHSVPIWTTPLSSKVITNLLAPYLHRRLGETTEVHGVFLDVLGVGVLITGPSSVGKSELALELVSRGAGLVADDVVELQQIAPEMLQGRCPEMLRDYLEVRGLGILNIKSVFGETSVRPRKMLKLVVQLVLPTSDDDFSATRLSPRSGMTTILNVEIPTVTLGVKAGKSMAVLVETAVRNYVLMLRGIDSTQSFIDRQHAALEHDAMNQPSSSANV
jgi:HPr kinase/phosphorylase